MSLAAMSEYVRYSKYAQYNKNKKRRDNWKEQVNKMFEMHQLKFGDLLDPIIEDVKFAKKKVLNKIILGSQRALQFSGNPILKKEAKIYNCTASYADRIPFFKESMYLLLCGCGVGFSVQKHHVAKLPNISKRTHGKKTFTVPDSIEGWSDALNVLMLSYFEVDEKPYVFDLGIQLESYRGFEVEFDYSAIRPEGSLLSWGGKAPGPEGLKKSLDKITELLDKTVQERNKLRPIDVYDIVMHASDAVLAGGVRRSATICLFSYDDLEMRTAKTGNWFAKNPQRGRSNNSVLLLRNQITKEDFESLMKSVKEFGEPGFIFADDTEFLVNPCAEISLYAYNENGVSGWQMCNLCEINIKKCNTEEKFLEACRAAAILGTLQAAYTKIDYLGKVTEEILKKECLLGISMTGMMDNPDIAFNPELQKKGAKIILETNEKIAKALGINICARATCIKPAGTTSIILETASGIHPHHAKRYFRRIQANKLEFPAQLFSQYNPLAVEKSVWSSNDTDLVLTFLCEVPDSALTKNSVSATKLLELVKLTQENWVTYGTRTDKCVKPWLKHNVSNTINVLDSEWTIVTDIIYENRYKYTGISLIPNDGDKDYPQAPFTTVYTPDEIVKEYGNASLMASGLIVDGLHAFNNNLWSACDCALGIGETMSLIEKPTKPINILDSTTERGYLQGLLSHATDMIKYYDLENEYNIYYKKIDWIRRAKQFAARYFNNDIKKMTYCLKDVHNWKLWCDLKREYINIDWSIVSEDEYELDISTIGGDACAGGACDIGDLGKAIKEKQSNH